MLERHNPKPLYAQLGDILREKIDNHSWKPHNPIPSETELSKEYGVSKLTARTVVSELAREGLLYRVPGKGTFVAEPKVEVAPQFFVGLRAQLEKVDETTGLMVLDVERVIPPATIRGGLAIADGEEVYRVRRLRRSDRMPLSLHISYIPAGRCPGLEKRDLSDKCYGLVLEEDYGIHRRKTVETLGTSPAIETDAGPLMVEENTSLSLLTNILSDAQGIPFEYAIIVFPTDRVTFSFVYDATDGNGHA